MAGHVASAVTQHIESAVHHLVSERRRVTFTVLSHAFPQYTVANAVPGVASPTGERPRGPGPSSVGLRDPCTGSNHANGWKELMILEQPIESLSDIPPEVRGTLSEDLLSFVA